TTANAATWGGEFAVAGKAVINSGKYEAKTKTSSAYAVGTSSRSKTTYDAETTVAANRKRGGNAEAYPILIIHGGTFKATSTTSTARGVSNGGYCTIDGGEFEAYATTTTAHGLFCLTGKITASGVKVSASATGTAYGALADVSVPSYSSVQTGFAMAGELELNNCDITATTRTSTEARGVFVNATNKLHNWTQFKADSTSGKWAATTTYLYYKNIFPCTIEGRDSVGIAIAAKATINGCDIKATAATTTAYGVYSTATSVPASADSVASPVVNIKNTKFTVKTDGTTTAYGVYAGGPTTIDGCDFTVQPKTTTAYGVYAYDKKTTITNTKFDVKGTNTVYGLYANAAIGTTTGWDYHGEFELGEGNDMTVAATGGDASHVLTLIAAKKNVATGRFMGDYANAATAHITGGSYKATATGKTCYVLNLSANQVQGAVSAAPRCTIEGGKFWAKATGGTDGICTTNGVNGNILFKGGVYNVNTNMAAYIADGLEEVVLSSDRQEYAEGYRYEIGEMGVHGGYVCQIGSTKYRTLEEALQVVTSGQVIYMIDNYNMLTPGDYILPSGATLLIPHKDGQKTIDTHPTRIYNSYTVPTAYRKLNFAEGVHLVVNGTIQAGGKMSAKGQTDGYNGMPTEAYGWLHLEEGSSISLENGAKLYAWGYVTGKGEIDAKNGSTVYEMFQVKDWRGGTCTSNMNGNSQKVFPLNQYYIQNIECPVKFRPGSRELCDGTVNAGSDYRSFDDVKFIGERNSGSFFEMESTDVSNNTWVRKWYDAENDKQVYEANSSVYMNSISLDLYAIFTTVNFNSSNYVLPVTNNMKIHLLSGHMYIMQNTELLPGAEIEVDKLATVHINSGKSVYLFDIDEWNEFAANVHTYTLPYSPSWGTTCPRNRKITNDASINVHGTLQIDGNLYTTEGGANIFSTNEDAGTITFNVAAPTSQGSVYVANNTEPTYTERKSNSAYLKNGDGTYEHTSGTAKDKTWIYENNQWKCWTETGCYAYDAQNHPYAKPAAYEQLTSDQPDASHLHHDAATGARNFVWDENCYWWEVSATPTAEGYYLSLNADNNGKYNYYYYDSAADCWKIKTLTVTWSINGANTNYSVGYGTKPEWLGATPTKSSPSSDYALRWDGWTVSGDETVLPNDDLPVVTANTTFTAHFYEMYYQSLVTFRNDDGTVLESKLWNRGAIPSYEGTPVKEATAAQTFEFNGSWSPAITAVGSSSVEYVAQYTATTRKYTVTFVNYDMSVLGSTEVDYNTTPTTATFKAAIAPSDYEPYKPDNSAYSFEFDGWRLNGASSNGFVQVKGDQTYVAQFAETTKKYRISFVDDDGETVLHWTQLEYDAMPSYDGPATSGFDKQDAEWNYTFIGWTPATFSQVKDPQTYTANYTTSKRSYTISFDSNGGSAVSSITNEWGSAVTAPADPTRDGYTFAGWTPAVPATMPVENMECVAQWNVVTYNLTYEGLNGATNSNPATYTVETPTITLADPGVRTGYTFTGWTCGGEAITQIVLGSTGDKTITANWTLNAVTILWKSEDGLTTLETDEQVNIGDTPSFDGETPVKDATAQYTYTFDGWATEANGAKVYEINGLPAVTAAATYYAHFSNTVNNYTVSIVSSSTDYGTVDVASVATVPYGTVISTSANTINVNGTTVIATKKTDNAEYTYTFDGWTNGTAAVEGDLTVTANFTRTTNTYTVTWKNYEGTVLETDENVAYGTTPVYNGATPTKPNDGTYDYAFTGWSPEVEDVTGNATYTAQFVAVFPDLDVVSAETLSMTATNTNTTIHESGILTIPDGMTLTTTNFILKATTTTSGQLFADAANINAANAYFDLTLNAQTRTWYGVGVPWRVNAEYGIYGDGKHLVLGKDFDIIWYDGAERAAWGPVNNCYKYLEDIGNPDNRIVEPGRMYFMFFARPYNVIRFKKIAGEPLVYDPADGVFGGDDVSRFEGSTDETNWNWNGIANSYLKHVTTENAVSFAYRYKNVNMDANKTTQWELVTNFAGSKYVVGQPVMVQVPNSGTGNVWNVPASPSLAPVRKMTADGDVDRAEVLLTAHTGATDRILCVVKDDAEDKYTIGDDLVKFTTSNDVPQLWIRNYKHALAVNTIRLENNIANYPLTIVSPKAGDYKLSLVNRLATGIHLYLTFNGEAIADLTEGKYTLSLGKETSKAYGLRLVRGPRGTVTGVDEALSGKENVEKVVMDGVLYIIRQGKVYDAQGKFIRLQ
ncbi:MAG: InlB B-repeat-containing protein, partial [Paludibacteraceae bacterium]|nr:InlB B-repeat-containing protein [Paludibacteraceae bacterium]